MDDPERMLDQAISPLERAVLREGRAYCAPDGLRAHTLSALGLTASSGLLAALTAWVSAKSWTTKLVLAFSTVTTAVGIPVGYVLLANRAPVAQPAAPIAVVMPVPATAAPSPPAPVVVPTPAPVRAVDSPIRPPAAARASGVTSSSLRAEVAALDSVRSSLARDEPNSALALLAGYFRMFPRGRLRYEAQVLRIEAFAKAGQVDTAKRQAQEFLRRHPNSVLTARVRPYAEH